MIYSISHVSNITGIPASTIRFYEKEGLLPEIKRNSIGNRTFNNDDVFWIEIIKCLKDTGMSIQSIKNIVELSTLGDSTIEERKLILLEHREKIYDEINKLQKYIDKINHKILYYEGIKNNC